jgi:hypothetical protein
MVGVHFGVCYRLIDDAACAIWNSWSPFRCKELAHCWCIVEMRVTVHVTVAYRET